MRQHTGVFSVLNFLCFYYTIGYAPSRPQVALELVGGLIYHTPIFKLIFKKNILKLVGGGGNFVGQFLVRVW